MIPQPSIDPVIEEEPTAPPERPDDEPPPPTAAWRDDPDPGGDGDGLFEYVF